MLNLNIQYLHPNAKEPFKKHVTDACYDLTAVSITETDMYIEYGLGIATEIPEGWCALIFPRSSVSNQGLILSNSVAVIDSPYRGEWKVRFKHVTGAPRYNVGDRVCQFMLIPVTQLSFNKVDSLKESDRGSGGFGSTNENAQ